MKVKMNFIPEDEQEYALLFVHENNIKKENIVAYLESDISYKSNIAVSNSGKLFYLPVDAIYYIEAEANTRVIYTKDNSYHTSKRLYELLDEFPKNFIRISKSVILNINYVKLYQPVPNGLMMAVLKNNNTVYIARSYLKNLLAFIKKGEFL